MPMSTIKVMMRGSLDAVNTLRYIYSTHSRRVSNIETDDCVKLCPKIRVPNSQFSVLTQKPATTTRTHSTHSVPMSQADCPAPGNVATLSATAVIVLGSGTCLSKPLCTSLEENGSKKYL